MSTAHPTRAEAISAAGIHFSRAKRLLLTRPPRESAEAAYVPGGPPVEELERRICDLLGVPYAPTTQAA